ncbi:hypothetical protein [Pollutibacter soli]|uniref:hypothetical protein n=1 Tax=Pollutibacter soli TaxID=3034157 RepID=UPI0030137419
MEYDKRAIPNENQTNPGWRENLTGKKKKIRRIFKAGSSILPGLCQICIDPFFIAFYQPGLLSLRAKSVLYHDQQKKYQG